MPTYTTNLHLTKPNANENVDINVINDNMDVIDNAIAGIDLLQLIYPVGSIYINASNSSNPHDIFGFGTWQRIGTGRTLIDCGTNYTAGSTGGAATVTLTAAQSGIREHTHATTVTQPVFKLPNHKHELDAVYVLDFTQDRSATHTGWWDDRRQTSLYKTKNPTSLPECTRTTDVAVSVTKVNNANATSAHNNMPPYLSVYIWKRTA